MKPPQDILLACLCLYKEPTEALRRKKTFAIEISIPVKFWVDFFGSLLCFEAMPAPVLQEPKQKERKKQECFNLFFFSVLKLKQKAFKLAR